MCAQFQIFRLHSRGFSVWQSILAILLTFSVFSAVAADAPRSDDAVNWVYGPAEADLGKYAKVFVPPGYQFANAEDARGLLKRMNNPVPAALAGILTSPVSRGIIVFEFTETGYVRDGGEDSLNAAAILKKLEKKVAIQNQQTAKGGNPNVITTVEWVIQPEYNREDHLLEWAIKANNGVGDTVNHVVRLFGREGMLDGIAVQPHQLGIEPIPLRRLMLGVTFKDGHTYADYHKGDRLASQSVSDTITTDQVETTKSRLGIMLASIGAGVVLLGAGGLTVRRKLKKRAEKSRVRTSTAPLAHPPLAAHMNGSANGNAQLVNGNGTSTGAQANGKLNGHHKLRRRRVFNYQKYYADLLFQVSDRAYETDYVTPAASQNGSSRSNGTVHTDNNALGSNLGLIESQKTLIEEQQRLIREQTKLIEEKTRLIQEKNQVLEKQAELFGNNVF
jgi:uncharacterized membrane-anchored protein